MGLFENLPSLFNPKPNKTDKLLKNTTKDIAGRIGTDVLNRPYQPYQGQWTADPNDLQMTASGATNDLLEQLKAGAPRLKDYMGDYFNPYLEQVGAATMRDMNQLGFDRQSDWASQAHMAGAFGDAGYGVGAGQIEGNLAREAGDRLNQIYAGGWDEALRAAGLDVASLQNNQQAQLNAANALYTQGTQQQQVDQDNLNRLFDEYMRVQNDPERRMLLAAQIMNLLQGGDAQKSDKGSELLGTLGTLASTGVKIAGMV